MPDFPLVSQKTVFNYLHFLRNKYNLKAEAAHRMEKDEQRRLKAAGLPRNANLDHYDPSVDNGLRAERIHQLRELHWLDQLFSIVLQGPLLPGFAMMPLKWI